MQRLWMYDFGKALVVPIALIDTLVGLLYHFLGVQLNLFTVNY